MMKKTLLTLCAVAAAFALGVAKADTIDFSQFGPVGTTFSSPLAGTTTDGVGVSLISPNGSFELLQEGTSWIGEFPVGAPILFDGYGPGGVTLNFATGITSLTLAGQSNAYGAFTATATAYSGANVVDTASASWFNYVDPAYENTIPFLTVTGANITSVLFATTNDNSGLALYGGAGAPTHNVPEPPSLAMFGIGLVGLSVFAAARRRKRC